MERVTTYLLSIMYGESSESSVEEGLLLLLAVRKKSRKRKWVHEINESREYVGEYYRLCRELQSHEDKFFTYFRMSRDCLRNYTSYLNLKFRKSLRTGEYAQKKG